jgi:hypothetical protein
MRRAVVWIAIFFAFAVCLPLKAAEFSLGNMALNGYGSWYYGKSGNNNLFLDATEDGSYRPANVHLSIAAEVTDRLRVVTQVGWVDSEAGSEQDFDYIFAEWKLNSRTRARVGKVKMPFGIYSEFPDVGTLRPFLALPQAAYGPIGFLGQSYKGVGLTGSFGGRWKAQWDLYGGGTELKEDIAPEAFLLGAPVSSADAIETEVTRDVLGGRFVVETPIAGLSAGVSGLTGSEKLEGTDRRRDVFGLQAEYSNDALTVRGEHMHEHVERDLEATGSYIEVSYRLTSRWQLAAEVGRLRSEFHGVHPVGQAADLAKHDEMEVGLSYWVEPNLVLKLNYARIKGNAYAHPDAADLPAVMAAGALRQRTNVLLAGAQFSF